MSREARAACRAHALIIKAETERSLIAARKTLVAARSVSGFSDVDRMELISATIECVHILECSLDEVTELISWIDDPSKPRPRGVNATGGSA